MLGGVAVADLASHGYRQDGLVGWLGRQRLRSRGEWRSRVCSYSTNAEGRTHPEKAWTFYFTEAGGRIYGLTTDAPVEYAERMTTEAERFIESLRAKAGINNNETGHAKAQRWQRSTLLHSAPSARTYRNRDAGDIDFDATERIRSTNLTLRTAEKAF